MKFGNGDVKFSDENPGEYLFAGLGYRGNGEEPYYTNPGSLYFEGSASGTTDSCQLFFDDIARELAALGDAGTNYSIEFYYKIDDGYTFNNQKPFHRPRRR